MAQLALSFAHGKNKCPIYFTSNIMQYPVILFSFPVLTGRFRPHEVLTEASAADATALLKQMHAVEAM